MLLGNWAILMRLFCYAALVECLSIALGVCCMFLVSGSKIVRARKVLFGTHIYIVVVCVVEHRLYGIERWYTYRAYGQAYIAISVVWAIDTQMVYHDATQRKIMQSILYGGVGLQFHALVQTVEVHTGYHRAFALIGRLLLYNRCQGVSLVGGEACCLGLLLALRRPIGIVFFFIRCINFCGVMSQYTS